MKGIRIINRGTDAVALEFTSKDTKGYITFVNGEFLFSHPINEPS